MEEEKKSKDNEIFNQVRIGEIGLESSVLSIDELISRAIDMLNNETIKEYLSLLKNKKLAGAYLG